MAYLGSHQMTMTRGEITPLVRGRIDLPDYLLGLSYSQNFLPLKYGGVTRIAGTLDQNPVADSSAPARLIPYAFSVNQQYALEFSDLLIRVHTTSGIVGGGTPVEIVSPYLQADLWNIQTTHIGDVIYIACAGYKQRTLTRTSDSVWTLAEYDGEEGPWLPVPSANTTLRPANTGHAIPDMTTNTAPSGTASASNSTTGAWKAFSRDPSDDVVLGTAGQGWIQYDFGAGNEYAISGYMLQATSNYVKREGMPISWTIQGWDGSNWVTLDAHRDTSDWLHGERRHFALPDTQAYRYYRVDWDAAIGVDSGGNKDDGTINAFEPLLAAADQTAFNMTASAVDGINSGQGFLSTDVGRLIRALASDGTWRIFEIIAHTSTTIVTVKLLAPSPLPDTDALSKWQLSAWSDESGYPQTVVRHKGRLAWAGSDGEPTTAWMSTAAGYTNYAVSDPVIPDDAITVTLTDGSLDNIVWAETTGDDMLLGTAGGIRILSKRDSTDVMGPSNVDESGRAPIGCGAAKPVWIDKILVFTPNQKKGLYETALSLDEGGYVARELTMLAEHLFHGKVRELHYQPTPHKTLWVVLEDGSLVACTYDRQQQVFGVTRVVFGGADVTVESMCVLTDVEYDVPLLVVGRTVNGGTTYRVEKMADTYREAAATAYDYPIYFCSAGVYSGASTTTITGLSHLEGETVGVYDTAGTDLGDAVVASGQITVPDGNSVTEAVVGLRMTSKITSLEPPNVAESGEYLSSKIRLGKVSVNVFETYGLKATTDRYEENLTTEDDHMDAPTVKTLYSGDLTVHNDDGWSDAPSFTLETDRAYPATIRATQVSFERGT